MDYIISHKSKYIDANRRAIYGDSMGSYTCARAAAFEPRLSALLLNGESGISTTDTRRPDLVKVHEAVKKDAVDEAANALLDGPEAATTVKWVFPRGVTRQSRRSTYSTC